MIKLKIRIIMSPITHFSTPPQKDEEMFGMALSQKHQHGLEQLAVLTSSH